MNPINALTIPANPECVLINELHVNSGKSKSLGILNKYKHILQNVNYWHKFVVGNSEGLSRNDILGAILDHVHPLDLIPVFFAKDPNESNSYFLARNCEAAINKLYIEKLVVDHPFNKNLSMPKYKPLKISIMLNFANTNNIKIDVQKNVSSVLSKRLTILTKFNSSYNAHTAVKVLNLDAFHLDPGLVEYCPLAQPKIMYFVLHIAKNMGPQEIILTNNRIKVLSPLEIFNGHKISSIDLCNNEIKSISDLSAMKHLGVKELNLSGNPLCDCDEVTYVTEIMTLLPTLELLDNSPVGADKYKTTKKNYFCDCDSLDLVNQFLEYFFTAYDTDRKLLAGLYHKDAMFSLTCVYLSGQMSSATASLKQYSVLSRNLKKAADLSKTLQFLYRGCDKIINLFTTKLPFTEHDPYSFTTDLMYKSETSALLMVTGVFHEKPTSLLEKEQFLGFSRSFALQISGLKCVITNDQLHIYNGLTHQERTAFIHSPVVNSLIKTELIPKPKSQEDFADLIQTLSHLSGLNREWSKKCLDECNQDLKSALQLFVDLYKGDRIPLSAFELKND